MTDLWYGTSGPKDAEIVFVAESWGSEEERQKVPLVGESGRIFDGILAEAKLDRSKILLTNLIAAKPQSNETWRFFRPKASDKGAPRIGGLVPSDFAIAESRRLYAQLSAFPRKLVIAAGNWSLWGLSQRTGFDTISESNNRKVPLELQTWGPTGIMDWRGSMWHCEPHKEFIANETQAESLRKTKLLSIIHPAAIMRQWENRAPTVHDLKFRVPMALNNDWRQNPPPVTWAPPTFAQAVDRLRQWLSCADRADGPETWVYLANDIETVRRKFISCIGFADSVNFAMSIPFVARDLEGGGFESFWPPDQEATLVGLIRKVFAHPNIHIIGQNFIYDTQYIQAEFGVTPECHHDTMLCQNVVLPGTPKDLSFLSSLYCRYHWYWKEDNKDWNSMGDLKSLLDYNCIDNLRTYDIFQNQRQYLKVLNQERQFEFKMRTHHLCLRMMNRGVLIDTKKQGVLTYELNNALAALETELLNIIPQDFVKPWEKYKTRNEFKKNQTHWFRSTTQTKTLFYDILGFRVVNDRKTGRPTVGKEALMQLEKWYPEFTGLFQRLDLYGSADTTAGVVQSPLEHDGRMKCSYNPGGTETHRLSSSRNVFGRGTNLQNLTKGEEDE